MNAGTCAEALVDFTGGVHISIELPDPPQNLWELMSRAGQSKSLMGCGTPQGVTTNLLFAQSVLKVFGFLSSPSLPEKQVYKWSSMKGAYFKSCFVLLLGGDLQWP